MKTSIRSESAQDYFPIAEINALAFTYGYGLSEVAIVDGQRHMSAFDPDLSLVAESEGKIVGHVLFYPYEMRIDGKKVMGVCLAPLAVHPDYQKRGIGSLLISEGCRRAKEKGYAFSFLLGHSSYYPKFGYQMKMFGSCIIKINRAEIKQTNHLSIKERRVESKDIPLLRSMWEEWYGQVDLSIVPGNSILDWISHGKGTRSTLLTLAGEAAGYICYDVEKPFHIHCFLAKDRETAKQIIYYIHQQLKEKDVEEICLAVHPASPTTQKRIPYAYQSEVEAWDAAMIKILDPSNRLIVQYCHEVEKGDRLIGMITWPPPFQL